MGRVLPRVSATMTLVLAILLASIGGTFAVSAAMASPPGCTRCADVGGTTGGVEVAVAQGTSDAVSGRGTPGQYGQAPGRTTWQTIEEYATPACSGNGLNGFDAMCMAAFSCPAGNLVRFWIWHRVTTWQAGPPVTSEVGAWEQEQGGFCLGPDDPGITPIGVVISRVQTGFGSLPLPPFSPVVSPAPSTLVNIPTKLEAGSVEPVVLSTTPLPGFTVRVTATPKEWRWTFGDGEQAFTTQPVTTHVYERARQAGARVDVIWGGTFRLPGSDEDFPIRGTATVPGAPVTVDVREARTELVRD